MDNQSRRGVCTSCSASVLIPQKYIPKINSLHFSLLLLNSSPLLYICSFPCTHVVYRTVGDTEQMGLEWDVVVHTRKSQILTFSPCTMPFFCGIMPEGSVWPTLLHMNATNCRQCITLAVTFTVILLTGHQAQVGVLSLAHVRLRNSTTEETILKGKYQ